MEKVNFAVADTYLVGDLYKVPSDKPQPAVAIIGPMTYQKEQAPTEYAQRLAEQGFVALAYDSRYRGESGGEIRAWENPEHKVEDLLAAVKYLQGRADVDSTQVSIVAICQGSSEAVVAAAQIPELRGLVTIAGHYRDHEGDIEWLSEEGFQSRKSAGEKASQKYLETGEVDYVKASDPVDMNVGMPGDFVYDWYGPWAERGLWENRYAVMSDASLLNFESMSSVPKIRSSWLMFHGDYCFLPSAAKRHADAVSEQIDFEMIWSDTPHLAYYDQDDVIDATVNRIVSSLG
ncbi:MAG: alpha/beta hydrolase [Pseudomonadota bacterium]